MVHEVQYTKIQDVIQSEHTTSDTAYKIYFFCYGLIPASPAAYSLLMTHLCMYNKVTAMEHFMHPTLPVDCPGPETKPMHLQ
jgi:hypothetical protein